MNQIESINIQVLKQITLIKSEYEDILRDILPTNWMQTYDL